MATEDTSQEDKDKSFYGDNQGNNPIVNLQLSDKLKQKGVVQNIAVDRKASAIEVILNRGSKKTIVSTIYPNWNKTQNNFEKQANRKNLSKGDIVDIQDVLDDNHAIILQGILCNDANDKSAQSNNSQITDKKKRDNRRYRENKTRSYEHNLRRMAKRVRKEIPAHTGYCKKGLSQSLASNRI
jgi:hypothetical protein